ncbi:SOS response-associated peptidase [Enterococcus casseliflavus]|uniref:SOS response-associated peptidase n=1 Tax=Enterococcus casseliflavus TaxID=37734 RepID=UPI0039A5DC40
MCGRYFFDLSSSELKDYYDQVIPNAASKQVRVGYNEIFPSNHVVTLGLNKDSQIVPGVTKWGFQGFKKGQLMINARAETVEEKKTLSKPFKESRCVFPMSGFYEWDQEKNKILFSAEETEVMYVAGFYRIHKTGAGFETESIIMTTKPNKSVRSIHDRMPLIIPENLIKPWVSDLEFARNYLSEKMPESILINYT